MKAKADLPKEVFSKFDIRGMYPDKVEEELVKVVAKTLAEKVFKKGKVILGMDARLSSPSLYKAAKEVLATLKEIELIEANLITTPMLTFLVNDLSARGGMMITASHNPKEYNGIKATRAGGEPISGEEIFDMIQ